MHDLTKAMKALSDETRLRIMNLVLKKECCVCEVMQALEISQSRASRNLGILQEAGFLKARRDGTWMLYSLDWHNTDHSTMALARLIRESLADNEVAKRDRARLEHARRTGPGCG